MPSIKNQMNKQIEFLSIIQDDKEFFNKVESILLIDFEINAHYYEAPLYFKDQKSDYIYSLNYTGKPNIVSIIRATVSEDEYAWRKKALIQMCEQIKE